MRIAKMFSFVLVLCAMCLPLSNQLAYASDITAENESATTEIKRICTATLEDDFADDCVLVFMTNAASLAKLNCSVADFSV